MNSGIASPSRLRALLVLGRVSNLPTVWSNCLAGWVLGGGGDLAAFSLLCIGATLVYVAGMYLNDAFDFWFDSEYRKERPIPSGAVSLALVWKIGWGLLVVGGLLLASIGKSAPLFSALLVWAIIVYNALHKKISWSPFLMALCRLFLYLVAASGSNEGVTGWAAWGGIALALYIVGLSYLARQESISGMIHLWPVFLIGSPLVLAFIMNANGYRKGALAIGLILAIWVHYAIRFTFGPGPRQVGKTVSALLAGIVLVDLLAVLETGWGVLIFALLFGLALLGQRFIPAT